VAAWVAALGGRGRFVGKRADDPAGRVVEAELRARGVELRGPVAREGTGTVVSIATPDGRRTMLSDRGVAAELGAHEVAEDDVAGAGWLHVPGYSLTGGALAAAAERAAGLVGRVSADASSTAAIAATGAARFAARLGALRPAVLFANEEEAELLGASLEVDTLVVKRGARGCVVHHGGHTEEHPALPARVVDTTGAGDAFAAGYLLGGPALALAAAARCVARLGAMP
jgi:sugar/nucleoside kinase (ribokinase family)